MSKKFLVNATVSIILIILVMYFSGGIEVLREIKNLDLFYLVLAVVALFIMYLAMAYRMFHLLKTMGVKIKYFDVLKAHFAGMLAADFTPARVGYFSSSLALHYNYRVPSEKAFLVALGPQVFDFITKVLGGSLGILLIASKVIEIGDPVYLYAGVLVLVLMIVIMTLLMFSVRFVRFLRWISSIFKHVPFGNFFLVLVEKLLNMVERMQKHSDVIIKEMWVIIAMIAIAWPAKALSWYFVAKSVGITIDSGMDEFIFYMLFQPMLTILEFLPTPTLAGMGLSEGGAVLILGLYGIGSAKAAAFALVARFKTTLLSLTLGPVEIVELTRKAGKELKNILYI
ncbi:MAG: lysylphosphatidylglycerol synthase transmembrane domain-containing protein [Candidatus Anstonellales archaeon]